MAYSNRKCTTYQSNVRHSGHGLMHHNSHLYGTVAVAKRVGISLRQLYHWVDDLHVVEPRIMPHGKREFRRFTESDIFRLQAMQRLVEVGYTLKAAAASAKDNT
jgi:DNA-binding transcriptional MerR regulator